MAAHAIVLKLDAVDIVEGNLRMTFNAVCHDDVLIPNGEQMAVAVYLGWEATPAQIETAIKNATIEQAISMYPTINLPNNKILIYNVIK